MNGRSTWTSRRILFAIIVSAFIALAPHKPASAAPRAETPRQYSADCAGPAWDSLFQWFMGEHLVNGKPGPGYEHLSKLCQHRATVLMTALDVCVERYDEDYNNYFDALADDGDPLNDWRTHMDSHCSFSVESVGWSIAWWYEGTKPI